MPFPAIPGGPWAQRFRPPLAARLLAWPGLFSLLVALAWPGLSARGDEGDEDEDAPRAGVVAEITNAAGRASRRVDETPAWIGAPRALDPRLGNGPWRVAWTGHLRSYGRGEYRLFAFARGEARVSLGGKVVLAGAPRAPAWLASGPLDLPHDAHPLRVEFTAADDHAELRLFWSGPGFQLEPLDPRRLGHAPADSPGPTFERGRDLTQAMRCAACHALPEAPPPAPDLARLPGNARRAWLVAWLRAGPGDADAAARHGPPHRRMPLYGFAEGDAQALATYLLAEREPIQPPLADAPSQDENTRQAPRGGARQGDGPSTGADKKQGKPPPPPSAAAGHELLLTLGCLACHQVGEDGAAGLWGGGDLSHVADKRPTEFFAAWLENPARLNARHRMPVFALSGAERASLALYLRTLASGTKGGAPSAREIAPGEKTAPSDEAERRAKGRALFAAHRCDACHDVGEVGGADGDDNGRAKAPRASIPLVDWTRACVAAPRAKAASEPAPRQPAYALDAADARAVRQYAEAALREAAALGEEPAPGPPSGERLLVELNCLACHARNAAPGLAAALPGLAARHAALTSALPALTPPSLNSVGDKLRDEALENAIRRAGAVHRPWLQVRMPTFHLDDARAAALARHFIAADRVPDNPPDGDAARLANLPPPAELRAAGARLVTSDGFGCASCHDVGGVAPPPGPLNARGPELGLVGLRARRSWFERWTRNPARIVPGMEMPSIQAPVRGVLNDNLDWQLAATWEVLNQPDFKPPRPNALRVARRSNQFARPADDAAPVDRWQGFGEPALALTDVLQRDKTTFIKPLLIALPSRHNLLYDLETASLAGWWLGDAARQRTQGKSWLWEQAGGDVWAPRSTPSEFALARDATLVPPRVEGQFVTEFDALRHVGAGLEFTHRARFPPQRQGDAPLTLRVRQTFRPWFERDARGAAAQDGKSWERLVIVENLPPGETLALRVAPPPDTSSASAFKVELWPAGEGAAPRGARVGDVEIHAVASQASGGAEPTWKMERGAPVVLLAGAADGSARALRLRYAAPFAADRHALTPPAAAPAEPVALFVAPGYDGARLPLANEFMPTGLAWRRDGALVVSSLKGRVWLARDGDGDGLEDRLAVFSDELAAPYGVAAGSENGRPHVDVINKYALLRLWDDDGDDFAERCETLASGWGHTADYHDWAVGLPRDARGAYYLGLACQQDGRSPAAARWRGHTLRLTPRAPSADNPRPFAIEPLGGGHRFPMGLALNSAGELFATDNQGNYNPFNELNHVVAGARYGFFNKLEKPPEIRAAPTEPAVNIPHPWTRSVNGVFFLETPPELARRRGALFGPHEGHLLGCEYDTRRLIRLSLQRVEGRGGPVYQGAAYPFTVDKPPSGPPLLGPICGAVSPDGAVYIGGLRDSGWGGANNVGELARFTPSAAGWPPGIAEVKAARGGLVLAFTQPVDAAKAADAASYKVASYRRVATPAYGGPDLDRRVEKPARVALAADRRSATLEFAELRRGFVYEFFVDNLSGGDTFFPAEAHFTFHAAPE